MEMGFLISIAMMDTSMERPEAAADHQRQSGFGWYLSFSFLFSMTAWLHNWVLLIGSVSSSEKKRMAKINHALIGMVIYSF